MPSSEPPGISPAFARSPEWEGGIHPVTVPPKSEGSRKCCAETGSLGAVPGKPCGNSLIPIHRDTSYISSDFADTHWTEQKILRDFADTHWIEGCWRTPTLPSRSLADTHATEKVADGGPGDGTMPAVGWARVFGGWRIGGISGLEWKGSRLPESPAGGSRQKEFMEIHKEPAGNLGSAGRWIPTALSMGVCHWSRSGEPVLLVVGERHDGSWRGHARTGCWWHPIDRPGTSTALVLSIDGCLRSG